MNRRDPSRVDPLLEHLRALPFVQAADLTPSDTAGADAALTLETPAGPARFLVDIKGSNLTGPLAASLLARLPARSDRPWLVFAPHVGKEARELLVAHGVGYVDAAGNLRVAVGQEYLAVIEGRPPLRSVVQSGGMRAAGYQVLFTLLARPELVAAPVRTLAEQAGVGKSAAAEALRRLEADGLIVRSRERRFLPRPETLDRWLAGYVDVVRPHWLLGRYRTPETSPDTLEQAVAGVLRKLPLRWGWGGGAAALRLTGHYRGPETVILVEDPPPDLPQRLRAMPAREGGLVLMRCASPLALTGVEPETVHPLLVYAELIAAGDERAREAASEIRRRYLSALP